MKCVDSLINQNSTAKSNIEEVQSIISDLTQSLSDGKNIPNNTEIKDKLNNVSKLLNSL